MIHDYVFMINGSRKCILYVLFICMFVVNIYGCGRTELEEGSSVESFSSSDSSVNSSEETETLEEAETNAETITQTETTDEEPLSDNNSSQPLDEVVVPVSISATQQTSQTVPFILPYDDNSGGIANAGNYLNHKPAGVLGSVEAVGDGHFSVGGLRIRFLGVNITAASCFLSHEDADKVAARLAKFGINLVRFHHLDSNWAERGLIDYSAGNSRTLDADNFDRLDYFIAQLKAHGIYSNLNLISAREFQEADGLPAEVEVLSRKERNILGYLLPEQRALEKEYAQALLQHKNPYTTLTYAEDPAIAFIEINNENSIFLHYFSGEIDNWPTLLKQNLTDRWNTWLSDKYSTSDEAEIAWGAINEPLGEELVTNGTFAGNINGWQLAKHSTAEATATTGSYDGRDSVALQITQAGTAKWHVQFMQSGMAIEEGQVYTLGMWLQADAIKTFELGIQQAVSPFERHQWYIFSIDNDWSYYTTQDNNWSYYTTQFVATRSDDNVRINITGLGLETGTLYLSDVSLRPGGKIGTLQNGESIEDKTVTIHSSTGVYPEARQRDWMAFLLSLENDYWSDMHSYIRDTLGVTGLITGTQIMNSPPSVQQQFPFVDAHAYWAHPVFPGEAWDPQNWYVENKSMVNFLDNTFHRLANQRIAGKPFTVSEYQHASPNQYSSEAPLLAAAYGSLQDWDGIYLFSYDQGLNGRWDNGYFDNYFNIADHPAKMANLIVAANIFRRGDVASARNLIKLNFSPAIELDILAASGKTWNVANGYQLDPPPATPLIHRVSLDTGGLPTGIDSAPPIPAGQLRFESDTDELAWDISQIDKGVVTIDTEHTKSIIGYIGGRVFQLGNTRIEFGGTELDWVTVSLTMQEGSFAKPEAGGRLLIVASGLVENTGMGWTNDTKISVSDNWGQAPTLVEVIPFSLELPFKADSISVWSLDENGQRDTELQVSNSDTGSKIEFLNNTNTLWYELDINPQ